MWPASYSPFSPMWKRTSFGFLSCVASQSLVTTRSLRVSLAVCAQALAPMTLANATASGAPRTSVRKGVGMGRVLVVGHSGAGGRLADRAWHDVTRGLSPTGGGTVLRWSLMRAKDVRDL